jgi:amino acid transporter
VLLVSFTIGQFARRMGAAGSLYSYAARAFGSTGVLGPAAALAAGFSLLLGYACVAMFALAGSALYFSDLLASFGTAPLPGWAAAGVVIVLGAGCLWLLLRGIGLSSKALLLTEGAAVLVLLAVLVVVFLQLPVADAVRAGPALAEGHGPGGLASGAVLALTAFVGFESATVLGVETRKPLRTIPRVIAWSAAGTSVLYLLATQLQLAAGITGAAAGPGGRSFDPVLRAAGAPWLIPALDAGAALSFAACAIACLTALARVLLTMGREGVVPAWFGRAHPRFQTPFNAVLATVPVVTLAPALLLVAGTGTWASMNKIIGTAATAYVAAYLLVCIAALVFLRRIGELTFWPAAAAATAALALAGALVAYRVTLAGQGRNASGWIYLALVGGALLWSLRRRRRAPEPTDLGLYDVPTRDALLGGGTGLQRDSRR